MGELHPTKVLVHCDACQRLVDALVMVPPPDLIDALERPGSIRACTLPTMAIMFGL
jgi:hypothetical protein